MNNLNLDKNKKDLVAILIAAVLVLVFSFISIEGLPKEGSMALGMFFASIVLWIGVSIDWTSIVAIFMVALLPSFGFTKALSGAFGNSTVLFLLFTFMLVYPLSKTNFIRKVSLWFIQNDVAKKGPWFFITFLFMSVFVLGLFISPSVLFVAFMPFLQDILNVLDIKKGSKIGNVLMMGVAFVINMSSGCTPIGHVWPTIAMTTASSFYNIHISVFKYMLFGIPCGLILLVLLILIFKFLYKIDVSNIDLQNVSSLHLEENADAKSQSKKEFIIVFVLVLVILLWILPSLVKNVMPNFYNYINKMTTAMPPMLGCILLFLLRDDEGKQILNFNDVMKNGVFWGAIFMTGAATLIGSVLTNETIGISKWIGDYMTPISQNMPSTLVILFFVSWAIIQTNFASNIVTTTMVSSIVVLVLANNQKVDGVALCCLIGFCAAICNMTPAGQSTINTVAISSGYTNTKSMFVWGGVFSICAIIILSTIGYQLLTMF